MAGCWSAGGAMLGRTAKSIFTVAKLELMENQCYMLQYQITASLHHTSIHYGSGQQQQRTQYNIVTITQRHLHLQPDTRDGEVSLCGYSAVCCDVAAVCRGQF